MNTISLALKDVFVWLFQDFAYRLYDMAEAKFTLHTCAQPGISPSILPSATQGVAYATSVEAMPPYNPTWPVPLTGVPDPYIFNIAEALITYIGVPLNLNYGTLITSSGGGTAFVLAEASGVPNRIYVKNVLGSWLPGQTITPDGIITVNTFTTLSGLPTGWSLTTDPDTAFIGGTTNDSSFNFVLTIVNDTPSAYGCATFIEYFGTIVSGKKKRRKIGGPLCFDESSFPEGKFPPSFTYQTPRGNVQMQRIGETCFYVPYQRR